MSGKKSKRTARATLGARKPTRTAPVSACDEPTPAQARNLTGVALDTAANPPAPVLCAPATSVQAHSIDTCAEAQPAGSSAELLVAIEALLGADTDDEAVLALHIGTQAPGNACDAGPDCDVDPSARSTDAASNGATRAVTRGEIVTNWTVRNAGKVVPPKCNDYELWTIVQLRKECAEINFRLGRKVTRSEQIRHLKDYDAAQRAVQSSVDDENRLEPRLRKAKHCVIRLLNILSSDRFVQRLLSSDDAATRDQIDAGEVNQKTALWKDVGVQFRTNTSDFNNRFAAAANDPNFAGIDPSNIVEHETSKLYDMWKKVNGNYVKAFAKFNVSGQNSNEFYDFCSGDLDVAYLHVCVEVKPELGPFVKGGMREEDEVDSLNLTTAVPPTTKSSKWQDQVLKTINRMADIIVKAPAAISVPFTSNKNGDPHEVDVLLDRIAKLHQLIDQVKESRRKAQLSGSPDSMLTKSLEVYQQRLQRYEAQLADLD